MAVKNIAFEGLTPYQWQLFQFAVENGYIKIQKLKRDMGALEHYERWCKENMRPFIAVKERDKYTLVELVTVSIGIEIPTSIMFELEKLWRLYGTSNNIRDKPIIAKFVLSINVSHASADHCAKKVMELFNKTQGKTNGD